MRTIPFFLFAVILYSCVPGRSSETNRKKMPELSDESSFEGPSPFGSSGLSDLSGYQGFYAAVPPEDIPRGYLYFPLPDPSGDSMSLAVLQNYKDLAIPFLQSWARDNHQGIAIDLASHRGAPIQRGYYTFQKEGMFSIPVLLLWDDGSAGRVATLELQLNSLLKKAD